MLTREEARILNMYLLELDAEITVVNDEGFPTSPLTNPLDHALEYIEQITEED